MARCIFIHPAKNYPYPGLGVELGIPAHEEYLVIYDMMSKGDIFEWNNEHKDEQVKEKDCIM